MPIQERDGGIGIETDQGEVIVLRRWFDGISRVGVAGMALGSPTPASSTGFWWQPLVLDVRGGKEKERLLPYAQDLYAEGVTRGIIRGEFETFREVAL